MKTEVPETLQFTLFEGSGGLKQKSFVFKGFSTMDPQAPCRKTFKNKGHFAAMPAQDPLFYKVFGRLA